MIRIPRGVSLPLIFALAFGSQEVSAQFDEIAVPEQMAALNFMVGDWVVDGVFRTPDHIHTDRTLWYLTRGGGITQFDGRAWTAFAKGESSLADSLLAQTSTRAQPYQFTNSRSVNPIQDGFAMLLDEGRTSGSAVIYFDTERSKWVATQFHAPTNSVTTSNATAEGGLLVFEGQATDRRGERIFRQIYEQHGPDHYSVTTDISFDEGQTWIDDQVVLNVRRKLP